MFEDLRAKILNGGIKTNRKAVYIERLGGWVMAEEPMADKLAEIMQSSVDIKTKKTNIAVLFTGLIVHGLRYPHPDAAPDSADPHAADYPLDHPQAGQLVFQPLDREAIGKSLPGGLLTEVAQPIFDMTGLKKEDLDEEKKDLKTTGSEPSATPSQNA
jgi:hypothetical protein